MRYRGRRGKGIEPVSGRKFIIAIVVVTSALSFTLGYFVGKAAWKGKQPQYIGVESQPQLIATPQHKTEPLPQEQLIVSTTPRSPSEPDSLKLKPVQTEKENNPPLPPDETHMSLRLTKGTENLSGETPDLPVGQPSRLSRETFSEQKETKSVQKTVAYTVQVGAFKNLKDAEALKHRLEKKGYKVYIKKSAKTKDLKLFKVRTGEFTDKEKAETVALKLKNTEGLQAFVTPKNEKQEVRNGK